MRIPHLLVVPYFTFTLFNLLKHASASKQSSNLLSIFSFKFHLFIRYILQFFVQYMVNIYKVYVFIVIAVDLFPKSDKINVKL